MSYVNIQSVDNVYLDDAKMIRFRLNKGWDYVWVTYNDEKGFITISSSYGNYSYIWSSMGEGVTLRQFFSRANADYLANKFFSDRYEDKFVFDVDLAFKELKQEILQQRREVNLSTNEAREVYNEVINWMDSADLDAMDRNRFYDSFYQNTTLTDWSPDFWESNYGRKLNGSFLVLHDEVIPLIQNHFLSELAAKSEDMKSEEAT